MVAIAQTESRRDSGAGLYSGARRRTARATKMDVGVVRGDSCILDVKRQT